MLTAIINTIIYTLGNGAAFNIVLPVWYALIKLGEFVNGILGGG